MATRTMSIRAEQRNDAMGHFRTHAPQHKYATRRMLRLKMCTIMVALRAGLCVRVVPE
jgi:hypothetical protein